MFLCVSSFLGVTAHAGTLTGTVRNGTTGQAAANQDVVMMQLQGGMQPAGTFKTDAQGRFRIDHPAAGVEPVLLRVQYRGVNYHANVPAGQAAADIEIFEATASTAALEIESRLVALQPSGAALIVGEEFSVHNHSQPKVSVFNEQGNFEFHVPQGGELGQVSAAGPAGLPLVVGTMDKGKGRYAIAFAFRPGESSIRVSYQIPYAGNQAKLSLLSTYAVKNVLVIAPPTLQVQGEGFVPRGQEQGWNVYGRANVSANAAVSLSVSGTAPPPAPSAERGGPTMPSADSAPAASISVMPQRLDSFKWILIIGLGIIMCAGAFLLWKRPVLQMAAGSATAPSAAPMERGVAGQSAPMAARSGNATMNQVLEQAQKEAQKRLDEIKEMLVRAEMRKQAGAISEEEYARERARAEELLRQYLA